MLTFTAISNLRLNSVPMAHTDFELSPFAGPPSLSVDKAGHDLLNKTTVSLVMSSGEVIKPPSSYDREASWRGLEYTMSCIA
jgi:hypothetical protein